MSDPWHVPDPGTGSHPNDDETPVPLTDAMWMLRSGLCEHQRQSPEYVQHRIDVAVAAARAEERKRALTEAADAIQALHPGEVKASVTFLRNRAALTTRDDPTPAQTDADAGVRRFVALMRRGNPSPAVAAVLDEVEAALTTKEAPRV